MTQVPTHLNHLFWDVRVETFDPRKYPAYTIARILELGDEEDVKWMRQNFSEYEIKDVVMKSRNLSPKSANFWAFIYGIPAFSIVALRQLDKAGSRIEP